MKVWADIVEKVSEELPPVNDYLISEFRQNQFHALPDIIDRLMTQMISHISDIKYLRYRILNPMEQIEYKFKKLTLTASSKRPEHIDINDTRIKIMEFHYEAILKTKVNGVYVEKTEPIVRYLLVPFLYQECLLLNGTKYYPIFNILDKLTRAKVKTSKKDKSNYQQLHFSTSIILLVFEFSMKTMQTIKTIKGKIYESKMLTVVAHNNKKFIPALLYCIIHYGIKKTLSLIGFKHEYITVSLEPSNESNFDSILLPNNLGYVNVDESYFTDIPKRRALVTIMYLMKMKPPENLEELFDKDRFYWKTILGNYIHYDSSKPHQKMTQVTEHLKTCDRLIESGEIENLRKSKLYANNFYELCLEIFFYVDRLFIFDQRDLFEKQFDVMQQFLFSFKMALNGNIFNRGMEGSENKNDKTTLKYFDKQLLKGIYKLTNMFTVVNELCHDNWLLGPGCKKYRSKQLKKVDGDLPEQKGALVDPTILAHPSSLFIESIVNFPSSKPCITGSINIMFQGLEPDGTLTKPEHYSEYENIFGDDE